VLLLDWKGFFKEPTQQLDLISHIRISFCTVPWIVTPTLQHQRGTSESNNQVADSVIFVPFFWSISMHWIFLKPFEDVAKLPILTSLRTGFHY